MKRREFITLIGGAAVTWPLAADAQQKRRLPVIGLLHPGSTGGPAAVGFYEGLRELGYAEGLNIAIERRYGDWNTDRFQQLAADLVRLKPEVIVVVSTSPARAAKQATSTIPIVVGGMADPVGDELIVSLARPGGNITGNTFLGPELIAKRFELLNGAIPGLSRVTALWHPSAYGERTMDGMLKETEAAAQMLRMQLQLVPAAGPGDLDGAFLKITREHADAVILLPSPMLYAEHKRIVELAAISRLPAMYAAREFVEDGGLMSYGASQQNLFRHAAMYVDKILKGANPADLPVEQPTKLEFVFNLKTAKELGLVIPRDFLLLADDLIE
ncbi:ABC transporter substrate-binding protein [Bradyrhizobium sp. CSS354]|jgi:putative tryptophan/tyrosine transport system substrate-binding protein|uniref:ABC transporter substrate-binding protein n=1 Tax=Bradyrhizobium sp. CSS354 TaxID=2699172 RepID=UPI0023B0E012|nr:ABC transporter substrate-binding protein [Bradyrhizobium sp. CSS354]MDE5463664.1 ABC transporter substrate-binding protein [Bradyrhizobium sp. CSS354]